MTLAKQLVTGCAPRRQSLQELLILQASKDDFDVFIGELCVLGPPEFAQVMAQCCICHFEVLFQSHFLLRLMKVSV